MLQPLLAVSELRPAAHPAQARLGLASPAAPAAQQACRAWIRLSIRKIFPLTAAAAGLQAASAAAAAVLAAVALQLTWLALVEALAQPLLRDTARSPTRLQPLLALRQVELWAAAPAWVVITMTIMMTIMMTTAQRSAATTTTAAVAARALDPPVRAAMGHPSAAQPA